MYKRQQHKSPEPLVPTPARKALYELCLAMELSAAHLKVANASRSGQMPVEKRRLLSLWLQACCSFLSHTIQADEGRLSATIRSCVRNSFGSDKGLDHENTCNPVSADPKGYLIQSANHACPQDARSIDCDWFEFLAAWLGDMTIPGSSVCLTASEHEPRMWTRFTTRIHDWNQGNRPISSKVCKAISSCSYVKYGMVPSSVMSFRHSTELVKLKHS